MPRAPRAALRQAAWVAPNIAAAVAHRAAAEQLRERAVAELAVTVVEEEEPQVCTAQATVVRVQAADRETRALLRQEQTVHNGAQVTAQAVAQPEVQRVAGVVVATALATQLTVVVATRDQPEAPMAQAVAEARAAAEGLLGIPYSSAATNMGAAMHTTTVARVEAVVVAELVAKVL